MDFGFYFQSTGTFIRYSRVPLCLPLCETLSVPFGSDEGSRVLLGDCWAAEVVECLMGVEVMMAEPTEVVEFRVMFCAYILFGVVVLCT